MGHLRHLPGEGLPDRNHLPRETAPGRVDEEEDVLVGPQDQVLEGLADDDRGVARLRLRQGLRLREEPPHPMLESIDVGLASVVHGLLPLLQPPDIRLLAIVEGELHGVHVLRGYDLQHLVHLGGLGDHRIDRAVDTLANLLLGRGLPERIPVQCQHEVHDVLRLAQCPVVLRRLPVLEPHEVRVRAVGYKPFRKLRLLQYVHRRDRHLAAEVPDLPHGALQLGVQVGPARILRRVEVDQDLLIAGYEGVEG
mmetsp:Transcript_8732/g.23376  ORF Transcript_8732/g.23376 Transcript_8732/m.23376 type:complete len:252 (+) Transcript_8732:283-1038(+)